MPVKTVRGFVDREALGFTLAHEHVLIDLQNQFRSFQNAKLHRISEQKLSLSNRGIVQWNPYALRDNLVLSDLEIACRELVRFRELGGATMVDCTNHGIGRRAMDLKLLSERSGVNIVAGCGFYTYDTHPPELNSWSVMQIADGMIKDLLYGIGETDICAGIIGELGTSDPIHPLEEKVLKAACFAYKKTGVAVYVHTYPWGRCGLGASQILLSGGVPADKIVICHVDVDFDLEYIRALLDEGVWIEFDNFGKEFICDGFDENVFASGDFARDIDRVKVLVELLSDGYVDQLLLSNDICLKCLLCEYGGWGYGHILEHIVPMLKERGITQEMIIKLLQQNPVRLLEI